MVKTTQKFLFSKLRFLVVFYALMSLPPVFGQAQLDSTRNAAWVQIGFITDGLDRLGFQTGLNFQTGKHVLSARYYQNNDNGFVPFVNKRLNYIHQIQNLSLFYGYTLLSNKYFRCFPMLGISAGQGVWRNDNVDTQITEGSFISWTNRTYHYDNFSYLGAQVNLNALWTPTKYFGLGLDVFANIHQHSDAGIVLSIVLGKMRN